MMGPGISTNRIQETRPRWMPDSFVEVSPPASGVKLVQLCNFGIHVFEEVKISSMFVRRDFAARISLSFKKQISGAAFFSLGEGLPDVVIKPEVCVFPKIGSIGRWPDGFRNVIPVLSEMQRRGIDNESPVLWMKADSGHSYYGVMRVDGTSIREKLDGSNKPELEIVAYNAGVELRRYHDAGINHHHPHDGNYIVDTLGRVKLIDAKACTFESDYPHFYRATRRTDSWSDARKNDFFGTYYFLKDFSSERALQQFCLGYGQTRLSYPNLA